MAQGAAGARGHRRAGVQVGRPRAEQARLEEVAPGGWHASRNSFVSLVKGVKLTIVTTLVQIRTTLRNLTQNLDTYLLRPGSTSGRALAGRPRWSSRPARASPGTSTSLRRVRACETASRSSPCRPCSRRSCAEHPPVRGDRGWTTPTSRHGSTKASPSETSRASRSSSNLKVNPPSSALPRAIRCSGDDYLNQLLTPGSRTQTRALPPGRPSHLAYYLRARLGDPCRPHRPGPFAFTD